MSTLEIHPTNYVIGAGAIGRALAVFLKQAGKKVVVIRAGAEDLIGATESITVQLGNGSEVTETIDVKGLNELHAINGIVMITAKSYANTSLASKLLLKGSHYPIVLLQNGLNVEQPFITAGFPRIYRCVLFVTSQFTAHNVIRFKPVAPCPVGAIKGGEQDLAGIVEQINTGLFSFVAEPVILPVIWKKVIVNCVFNSVCPLLDVDNGVFYRDADALSIAERLIKECVQVAKACGVELEIDEVKNALLTISRASDGQMISTLQDIKTGRPTEISTLNLEVARIAQNMNMSSVVKETRLLGELIAIRSRLDGNL